MTFAIDDALRAVLARDHQPCARLLSLNPDGSVRAAWQVDFDPTVAVRHKLVVLDGLGTEDRTRLVRGSCTLTIANPDGSLTPNGPGDYFFTDEWFRFERGAIVDGTPFYIPIGTYVVSTYEVDEIGGTLVITGDDPTILAQRDFGIITTLNAGTTAEDCVKQILAPIFGDNTNWTLDGNGQSLPAVRSFLEDDKRLERLVGLLADMGLELFADRYGLPVLQPIPDPTTLPISASYTADPGQARLLDLHRSGSWHPVNQVVVIGESPGSPSVRGQADITDPSNLLYAGNLGGADGGVRTAPVYRSAQIVTQAQANAKAANLLIAYNTAQDAITTSLPPDLALAAGDVVQIDVGSTTGTFWVRTRTLPFVTGTMSLDAARVVPLFVSAELAA